MAATAALNRFASPSSLSSPRSSPAASRSNSPSRSDASQRSRCASRPPSNTSASYRNLARRLENYPSTWACTDLPPQQLAICDFSYSTKSGEDTCFCHVCHKAMSIQRMATLGEWSNDELLSAHEEDCLLADTIFDMINNVSDIYTSTSHPRSRTPEVLSPPPSMSPLQERPSSEYAAATPPPPTSTGTPTQPPPSSPRLVSPVRPSYPTVASRPCLTSPSPPPRPRRSLASTPPVPTTTLPASRASPPAPATTLPRRRLPHTSSPVLSIHDLERRFQNKSGPLYNQHLCCWHTELLGK